MSVIFQLILPDSFNLSSPDWKKIFGFDVKVKETSDKRFEIEVLDVIDALTIKWRNLFGDDCTVFERRDDVWKESGWSWKVITEPDPDYESIWDNISKRVSKLESNQNDSLEIELPVDSWLEERKIKEKSLRLEFYGRENLEFGDLHLVDTNELTGRFYSNCKENITKGRGRFFLQCKSHEAYIYHHLILRLANELKYDKPLVIFDFPNIPTHFPENPFVILRLDAEKLTFDSLKNLIRCDTNDHLAQFISAGRNPLFIHLSNIHNAQEQINGLVRCLVDCHFGIDRSASTAVFLTGIHPHCRGSSALDPGVSDRCNMYGVLV